MSWVKKVPVSNQYIMPRGKTLQRLCSYVAATNVGHTKYQLGGFASDDLLMECGLQALGYLGVLSGCTTLVLHGHTIRVHSFPSPLAAFSATLGRRHD